MPNLKPGKYTADERYIVEIHHDGQGEYTVLYLENDYLVVGVAEMANGSGAALTMQIVGNKQTKKKKIMVHPSPVDTKGVDA